MAMAVLDGNWVVAVLTALALGPMHFTKIMSEVNAVDEAFGRRTHDRPLSNAVLARTLERMRADGLIARYQDPSPHPSVRYELTVHGQELLVSLRPLARWAQRHRSRQHRSSDGAEAAPGGE